MAMHTLCSLYVYTVMINKRYFIKHVILLFLEFLEDWRQLWEKTGRIKFHLKSTKKNEVRGGVIKIPILGFWLLDYSRTGQIQQ